MNGQKQNESNQVFLHTQDFYSSITDGYAISNGCSDLNQPIVTQTRLMHKNKNECLNQILNKLRLGQRIYDELKKQGRTVTWLAQQLGMERTSLYYTFRQNSIDMELLMRISSCLEHNFFRDVSDMYEAFGL